MKDIIGFRERRQDEGQSSRKRLRRAMYGPLLVAISIILGGGSLQSCNLVERGNSARADSADAARPDIDVDDLRASLRALLVSPSDSLSPIPKRYRNYAVLHGFYTTTDAEPVWTASFKAPARIDTLIRLLELSYEHGLDPALYGLSGIKDLRKRFLAGTANGEDGDYALLARLELELSDAAVSFATHLKFGVLDPLALFQGDYFLPTRERRPDDGVLRAGDAVGTYLRGLPPQHPRYAKLIEGLRRVRELQRTGPLSAIPFPGQKLEPGAQSALLGQIERRIKYLSQLRLDGNPPQQEQQFTSKYDAQGYTRYDTVLVERVKEFQRLNGLLDDGVLGERSFKALNLTHEERIAQIGTAMERMRWLRLPDSGKYIRVNIPEFYLYAVDNGRTSIRMKVCVGMRYSVYVKGHSGKNYQTPMVSGLMHYIVLNPTWSVPPSIATRETYYQALKDSTYLRRHGYKVLLNNEEVSSSSIRWKDYKPHNLPFRFVQRPGEGNALGRIKFVFDNDFDIYLHDTPKRKPFTFASRTVSHGCIRIEEPMRMLDFLLRDHKTWFPQSVTDYLDVSRTTKWITLEQKVPVFVDYITVWVDERDVLQFRDDVYGKDRRVTAAMQKRIATALAAR